MFVINIALIIVLKVNYLTKLLVFNKFNITNLLN
ncbi:hypothetical protein FLSU104744_09255 [Flavobacterium succinicans]